MTLALGLRNSVISVIVAAAVVTSCSSSSLAPSQTEASRRNDLAGGRVLFIGNSLTEANGLPAMVETLSRQGGGTPISTASVVFGGFSLEDHWNEGPARRAQRKTSPACSSLLARPGAQPGAAIPRCPCTALTDFPMVRAERSTEASGDHN